MKFIFLIGLIAIVSCSDINQTTKKFRVTHKAWFDMSIDDDYVGKIVIGLFGRTMPITVKNFVNLATRPKGKGYIGSRIHIALKNKVIGGGDYQSGDGRGGRSSFGPALIEIENYNIKNYGVGWIASDSVSTFQSSLFFITLERFPHLDGRDPVFGKILTGINVVRTISGVPVDKHSKPTVNLYISGCGAEIADPPFLVDTSDAID